MNIDKASFLLALGTIAAGGAGGYFVGDRGLLRQTSASAGAAEAQPSASSAPSPSAIPASRPTCDDMVGTPAACPAPGYSADEGGCGAFPAKRCEDFKQTMKPRVAEHAVACLNSLNPAQRCDPNRVNLCAHAALMSACTSLDSAAANGASIDDDVEARCAAVAQACGAVSVAPTLRECRATLVGLSVLGRDRLVTCMRSHCSDKGLAGCEVASESK
jgi:hypothetical protein